MQKKTKQVAIRITPETYNNLNSMSKSKKWSIAFTANEILEGYFSSHDGGEAAVVREDITEERAV